MTAAEAVWIDGPRIPAMFGLNERTVREAANEGHVERRYIGRKPLYSVASIDQWIERQPQDKPA